MEQTKMTTGRIGYVHVCKDCEAVLPAKIEVYEFESGLQPIRITG